MEVLHDAKRFIKLVSSFNAPLFAVINKFDINEDFTKTVENYLSENNIPLVGKIPFTKLMVESMIEKKTVVEYAPNDNISNTINEIWSGIN